jgi:hypothetical protein
MSHVPRFWRENNFPGWVVFLKNLAQTEPNKVLNAVELSLFYSPHGEQEREKIRQNMSNALANLKTAGVLERYGKRGYYRLATVTVTGATAIGMEAHPGPIDTPETVAPYSKVLSPVMPTPFSTRNEAATKLAKAIQFALDAEVEIPLIWIEQYNNLIR